MNRKKRFANFSTILCLLLIGVSAGVQAQPSRPIRNKTRQESELLEAARRDPGNLQLTRALGEYYLRAEKWQQSALWLAKAYALSAGSESVGYDLAFAQMQSGALISSKLQIEQLRTNQRVCITC